MTEKKVTVNRLCTELHKLIDKGFGNKIVELSINYDNCDHIQPLNKIYAFENCERIDWIMLRGTGSELKKTNEELHKEIQRIVKDYQNLQNKFKKLKNENEKLKQAIKEHLEYNQVFDELEVTK